MLADETPINHLALTMRLKNCLRHQEVKTYGDLKRYIAETSTSELLRVSNLGWKSIEVLTLFMADPKSAVALSPDRAANDRFNSVLELREVSGLTFRQIGEKIGSSAANARRLYCTAEYRRKAIGR